MKHIAIFASGRGSNAQKIIDHFRKIKDVQISVIASNNPKAGVVSIAQKEGIDLIILKRKEFYNTRNILNTLQDRSIDLIVLAGFLWLIPAYLIAAFDGRIINIHPALLPKYGGKGMFGSYVHEAVKKSGDKISGITIHYVNEKFDEGPQIFQAFCSIEEDYSPEEIAEEVLKLEHRFFPIVIHALVQQHHGSPKVPDSGS